VEIWGCYEQKADARFFEFRRLPGILQMAIKSRCAEKVGGWTDFSSIV